MLYDITVVIYYRNIISNVFYFAVTAKINILMCYPTLHLFKVSKSVKFN